MFFFTEVYYCFPVWVKCHSFVFIFPRLPSAFPLRPLKGEYVFQLPGSQWYFLAPQSASCCRAAVLSDFLLLSFCGIFMSLTSSYCSRATVVFDFNVPLSEDSPTSQASLRTPDRILLLLPPLSSITFPFATLFYEDLLPSARILKRFLLK